MQILARSVNAPSWTLYAEGDRLYRRINLYFGPPEENMVMELERLGEMVVGCSTVHRG